MPAAIRVVTIPSADLDLAAEAKAVADRIPGDMSAQEALAWYRLTLRRIYPTAVVREQDELARVADAPPVWYVTRSEHHFRIDATVRVPLPAVAAWRVYVERVTEWQTAINLHARPQRAGLGAEYDATYSFLGRQYRGTLRVLAAEPGRFVSIEAEGSGITVWYVTSFSADGDATDVRVKGDYELPDNLLARVADRLGVERAIGRDIERANASYRALCLTVVASEVRGVQ